jgi:hypothetical protein
MDRHPDPDPTAGHSRPPAWFDNAHRIRDLLADLETRSLRAFHDAED